MPSTALRPFVRLQDAAIATCAAVCVTSFVMLALLILADVLTRNLGIGFAWALEGSEYLMMIGAFAGAPWVLRRGGHVAIDVIVQMLGASRQAHLARGADVTGTVICGLLTVIAADALWSAVASGALVFKTLVFPEWWLMVPVTASFALMTTEFTLRFARGAE